MDMDQIIERLQNTPAQKQRLQRSTFDVSDSTAGERSKIAEFPAQLPIVFRQDVRYMQSRKQVTDEYGRKPLFVTTHGRASLATLWEVCYYGTLWCRARDCPHGNRQPTCEFWSSMKRATKCPSSISPHDVRAGSIAWHRNRGWPVDELSERVNCSPANIERHYDRAAAVESFQERRAEHVEKLSIEIDQPTTGETR